MFVQTFGMIGNAADIPALVELAFDPAFDPDEDPRTCFENERVEHISACVSFELKVNTLIHETDATACVFNLQPGYYSFDVYDLLTESDTPIATGSCFRLPIIT